VAHSKLQTSPAPATSSATAAVAKETRDASVNFPCAIANGRRFAMLSCSAKIPCVFAQPMVAWQEIRQVICRDAERRAALRRFNAATNRALTNAYELLTEPRVAFPMRLA
jgi:hypothetical protein